MSKCAELRKLNVNDHVEKKNGLSYLTWSAAVDYLLQHDEGATWEFPEPSKFGDTLMVHCKLTAFGKTIQMHLPVMDHRNHAISNPNSVDVNKAMMRCLAKAIATTGIGLYIYAGEDLPGESHHAAPSIRQEVLDHAKELANPATANRDPIAEVAAMFDAKVVEPSDAEKREIAKLVGSESEKWFLDHRVHFGKNKGTPLCDLPRATLKWYADKWGRDDVTGIWKTSSTSPRGQQEDRKLRQALDLYMDHLRKEEKPGAFAGNKEPVRVGEKCAITGEKLPF